MRRKRSLWEWLCITGVPQVIVVSVVVAVFLDKVCMQLYGHELYIEEEDLGKIALLVGMIWLFVCLKNLLWIQSDKPIGLFTWTEKYRYEPPEESVRRKKAQHPQVSEEYLSDVPDQMPLGVIGGQYLQFDLSSCLALLLFGSPGAGKTTLLSTMILNKLHKKKAGEQTPALFVFDFKEGEMYRKSCMPDDERARFVSLEGREDWGWDPYYRLDKDSTDDDVIRELTLIANVLIESSNEKNAFFTETARTWIIFIGLYDFRRGRSFLQTIDHITGGDTKTMLQNVYDHVKDNPEFKKVKDALAEYVVIDDSNEALQNIKMTLKQKMSVFKVDDVRWALEYNPKKASPLDLEEGKSIFFYPGDTDVTDVVLKIIAKQLEYHCRHRDFMNLSGGGELRQIIAVCDECYSIGSVVDFAGWASVARAFRTSLIMIWQSYSQIKETFNESIAESLMDDVAGIAVLAVSSPKNAEQFVDFAGEYLEEKRTVNSGGKSDGTYSQSYEYKAVLTKKDFLQLRKNKEVIVLMDGEYARAKSEPARYYMIPELKEISDRCVDAHRRASMLSEEEEV